jgi:hypothetical protein
MRLVLVLGLVVGTPTLRLVLVLPGLLINLLAMDDLAIGGIVGAVRPVFFTAEL